MWIFALCVALFANIIRFVGLETSPPGFYVDEVWGASNILCLKETGHTFLNQPFFSLFFKVYENGYQSFPFYWGQMLWTSIFGNSVASFRSFMGVLMVLTLGGLFKLTEEITQSRKHAYLVLVLASILPWSFQFSRISWDAPMGTMFLVWGIYFVYRLAKSSGVTAISAGILLALAGYTYSPMRVQVALMVILLPGITWKRKITIGSVFGLLCIPAALMYLDPEFTARSKLLGITSSYAGNPYRNDSGFELFLDYLKQVTWHFTPEFLMIHGDHNLRHSIQSFGQLDYLTAVGLLATLITFCVKKFRTFLKWSENQTLTLKLSVLGMLTGVTPAALTWESVPHAIRGMGAWPFMVLFGSITIKLLLDRYPKATWAFSTYTALFFGFYAYSFFFLFPTYSQEWFDQSIVEGAALNQFPTQYRPLGRAYFLMTNQHESCESLRLKQ